MTTTTNTWQPSAAQVAIMVDRGMSEREAREVLTEMHEMLQRTADSKTSMLGNPAGDCDPAGDF